MPQDVLLAKAYQQATMFKIIHLIEKNSADYAEMKEALKEVQKAIAQNMDLTREQSVCSLQF